MTIIFGFLDEKCIRMEVCSMTFRLHPIKMSVEHSHLYRDLYEKMAFWPQWRHQWAGLKLQSPITREDKQLLRCGFFCSSRFFRYFLPFWYWKWWQFPFKDIGFQEITIVCFSRPFSVKRGFYHDFWTPCSIFLVWTNFGGNLRMLILRVLSRF